MTIWKTATAAAAIMLATGCGGPSDDASVPLAQPAGVNSADIGAHVVHFSAQLTDRLQPEVASAYNIVRSKNRAMLTVSIVDESSRQSVPGEVSVKTVNLTGQLKNVAMRPIEESGDPPAIYYIGITPVANRETLIFDITVRPDGVAEPSDVRFKQEFYTD